VVYVHEKCHPVRSLDLSVAAQAIARPGRGHYPQQRDAPCNGDRQNLLDVIELGREQLLVTRVPIEDERRHLRDRLSARTSRGLKSLIAPVNQLESHPCVAKRQLRQPRNAYDTFEDFVGNSSGISQTKDLARRAAR
jgi:hypothetical protein